MREFRYYCLSHEDRILAGAHITAPDLAAAIRAAHEGCRIHPKNPTDRVEIWQGQQRLYASAPADNQER